MMSDNWQPLTDIWDIYSHSLSQANDEGWIDDPELAEDYVWPADLKIGPEEQEDMKKYVNERMTELVERVKKDRGVDPNVLAGYVFRSVIVGMLWEAERIGR
jgi:hypothetical protein